MTNSMKAVFDTSFEAHKVEVTALIKEQNVKIEQHMQDTEAQITSVNAKVDELQGRVSTIEQNPGHATNSNTQQAKDKLWALEKALLMQCENDVILSNMTDSNGAPMPEITRKPLIDTVLKKISLKAEVTHIMQDKKLTQFSKISFTAKSSVQKFIGEWIKTNHRNGTGAPIYAKPDIPQEVRKLRQPLTDAERLVKKYFSQKSEMHKVRTYFSKHVLKVDDKIVAERDGEGQVIWVDTELQSGLNMMD